jgi:hypothetical protein
MKIEYETSIDTPYYAKLTMGEASVAVGEAPGAGDGREWEIIDCFDGKQLAFRRITDDYITLPCIWDDLMMRAHCELLTLRQKAVEQAERTRKYQDLARAAEDHLQNMTIMLNTMGTDELMTDEQLAWLDKAVDKLDEAAELIDDVQDPSER